MTREGTQALSLREIARRAGVSHGAPRRYFPTHLELLSAIAREGFAASGRRGRPGTGRRPGGSACAVDDAGPGLSRFALANRGMYELMFRHDLLESNHLGLREASLPLFHVVTDLLIRAGLRRRGLRGSPRACCGRTHGLAQLWGWGSLQLTTGSG
ncbi:TetR/AcrR family transcriptional regulator [Nonomuraea dietziae]|uniref:TetR/AcrR family transcriptional regulator n=1 Tax=Nonomuraea dietziae TaxID=65515 RepID=UPI0031E240E2